MSARSRPTAAKTEVLPDSGGSLESFGAVVLDRAPFAGGRFDIAPGVARTEVAASVFGVVEVPARVRRDPPTAPRTEDFAAVDLRLPLAAEFLVLGVVTTLLCAALRLRSPPSVSARGAWTLATGVTAVCIAPGDRRATSLATPRGHRLSLFGGRAAVQTEAPALRGRDVLEHPTTVAADSGKQSSDRREPRSIALRVSAAIGAERCRASWRLFELSPAPSARLCVRLRR